MDYGILEEAAEKLIDRGFENVALVQDLIEGRGATHFVIWWDDTPFSVRAKQYRYDQKGSFGLEHARHAADHGHHLVSYIADDELFRVYDPKYVARRGDTYTEPSKNSPDRTWVELDMSHGTPLTDFIEQDGEVTTLAGDNATLDAFG